MTCPSISLQLLPETNMILDGQRLGPSEYKLYCSGRLYVPIRRMDWLNAKSCLDLSPVGDAYKKKGLALASHRTTMCDLAVNWQDSHTRFVMVDRWEALQTAYQPTARVLDHFDYEINTKLGGIDDGTGKKVKAKIALLGGADLVETFSQPGVWSVQDLTHILCDCECQYKGGDTASTDIVCYRWRIHHRARRHRSRRCPLSFAA